MQLQHHYNVEKSFNPWTLQKYKQTPHHLNFLLHNKRRTKRKWTKLLLAKPSFNVTGIDGL